MKPYWILISLLLVGCASVQTKMPMPDASAIAIESGVQEKQAFKRLLSQHKRLDKIGSQILIANAPLCEKKLMDYGLTTHSLKSYPKHIRPLANKHLGAQEVPSILFVRKNGAAQKAGIKAGDILLGEDDKPVSAKSLSGKKLTIKRGDKKLTFMVIGTPACGHKLKLKNSGAVNAYADGKNIIITSAMMDFADSDRELALVIGHELAHNTMDHVKKAIWNSVISGFASRTTRPFEAEADYVGLYYTVRAGFDIEGVEEFWRRLGVLFPKAIVRKGSHPLTPERLLAIRMTAKEIADKKKAGEPLLPNKIKEKTKPPS